MLEILLAVAMSAVFEPGPGQDSVRIAAREARSAAFRYERALVESTPPRFGGGYGSTCDERIGRYCFWYSAPDRPRRPADPETPQVTAARDAAIHVFRRWFALAPEDQRAVGPLLRYLIEADRPAEAAAAARAHVWAAERSPDSFLFLGLALHHNREFAAAEAAFDSARALLPDDQRRDLDDIRVLLDPGERSRYRSLPDDERVGYEARFWAFSDPWLSDPGNERRSAHYARHAWSRILSRAPRPTGRLRWGQDDHELLIRYGMVTARQQIIDTAPGRAGTISLIEWFDPRRVALDPPDLVTRGVPPPPLPGERPAIERDTVRSHYAPIGLRRTRGLTTTASVFPGSGVGVLRVDAILPPDSVEPRAPAKPQGLLVVLDTLGREVGRVSAEPFRWDDSLTAVTAEYHVPPGAYVFRIEVKDDSTGLGGLAQHRVDVPAMTGLTLSDLLIALPDLDQRPESREDGLRAIPHLVFHPGQAVAVYAELSGRPPDAPGAVFDVEWWVERADDGGLLRRAARWLGERVGLVESGPPVRVAWQEPGVDSVQVVFLNLTLPALPTGLHRLGLRVRDPVSGEAAETDRLIRVDSGAASLVSALADS